MPYDFELAINHIPGLAWSAEPSGFVDFLNQPWLEYTGMAIETARGWGWQGAIHPADLPGLVTTWQAVLGSAQAGVAEARLRRHDGVYRWFLFHAVPRYEEGALVKWYGQTIDIEQRKRAELLLAHENDLLEMIARGATLEAVMLAMCEHIEDLVDGAIASILLLDAARNCLRHAAGPRLPRSLIEHIDGRVIGTGGGPCGKAAQTGAVVIAPDLSTTGLAAIAATWGLGSACCTPILSSEGKVLGTFALYWRHTGLPDRESQKALAQLGHVASIAIERTGVLSQLQLSEAALLRTQDELAHASRVATLGELTGSIAHELNQPLTGIGLNAKACLRWLAAAPPELGEARQAAERIVRDAQRAGDVILRLRAMFNKTAVPHEAVDLDAAIHEVLVLARNELQRHRVEVRTDFCPALPPVSADRVQVQQVVLNLVLNAIEALASVAGRPREIVIETRQTASGAAEIAVTDNGTGIEPSIGGKIFDAFYTSKAGGMGMGLAIARSIVERFGGRLWLDQNEGDGVTFRFTLAEVGAEAATLARSSAGLR